MINFVIKNYIIKIDEENLGMVSSKSWSIRKNPSGQIYFLDKNLKALHRLITNCPKGMVVDHINGDTLNNTLSNLRICTKLQNQYNQKKHKGVRHSKYKGVTKRKDKRTKPWEAFIYNNGKSKRLGYFATEIEAAKAYNKAAKLAYGEFAKLNDILPLREAHKRLHR